MNCGLRWSEGRRESHASTRFRVEGYLQALGPPSPFPFSPLFHERIKPYRIGLGVHFSMGFYWLTMTETDRHWLLLAYARLSSALPVAALAQ